MCRDKVLSPVPLLGLGAREAAEMMGIDLSVPGQRLGLVVPSSNSVAEPVLSHLARMAGEVDVYASRLRVTRVDTSPGADRQFDLTAMEDAASLLADLGPSAVAWAGTAGAWLGAGYDREAAARLSEVCHARAVTSSGAVLAGCQELGLERAVLVTPYTGDIVSAVMANFAAAGLDVVAEAHLGMTRNADFALVPPATLHQMAESLLAEAPRAQVVVVLCTNLAGWHLCNGAAAPTSRRLPVPVVDSVVATFWALLRHCGRYDLGPDGTWARATLRSSQ